MANKKSYMNQENLLTEGFFDQIKKFTKDRPKVKGTKKISLLNKIKLAMKMYGLNKATSDFEKAIKKHLGDDYPDLPRYKPSDFIR